MLSYNKHVTIKIFLGLLITTFIFNGISSINAESLRTNQIDNIDPILDVLSPSTNDDFSETSIHIVLEGSDETAWKNLLITIGQAKIFDLENSGETVITQDFSYSNSSLTLDKVFDLGNQDELVSKELLITFSDYGDNNVEFSINVIADLEKPIIEWLNLQEELFTTKRSLTLKWSVTDQSSISSQFIQINGEDSDLEITEVNGQYSSIYSHGSEIISPLQLVFTIVATDNEGNVERSGIKFYLNPPKSDTGGTDFTDPTTLITIGLTLLVIFLILLFIVRSGRDPKDKSDLHNKWEGELSPPPLLLLMETQLKIDPSKLLQLTDAFTRIEDTWNETSDIIITRTELRNIDISDFIDTFVSNLMLELIDESNFNSQLFRDMEIHLAKWKEEVMAKPKRWKGSLVNPPLPQIVEDFSADKFRNYEDFSKTITSLMDTWQSATEKIIQMEKPIVSQIRIMLSDYRSETTILMTNSGEFDRNQLNHIENLMEKWMKSILKA